MWLRGWLPGPPRGDRPGRPGLHPVEASRKKVSFSSHIARTACDTSASGMGRASSGGRLLADDSYDVALPRAVPLSGEAPLVLSFLRPRRRLPGAVGSVGPPKRRSIDWQRPDTRRRASAGSDWKGGGLDTRCRVPPPETPSTEEVSRETSPWRSVRKCYGSRTPGEPAWARSLR